MERSVHAKVRARRRQAAARSSLRAGFTLLETMLAVLIVAIGVLAAVDAQTYFDRSNSWSSQSTVGMYLANEVRQAMEGKPRHENSGIAATPGSDSGETATGAGFLDTADDIDDFHNVTFGPALGTNASGQPLALGERVATAGAINASGAVISDVRLLATAAGEAGTLTGLTLQDWSQHVTVEKVSPRDLTNVVAWNVGVAANGSSPAFAVDRLPLRVTVDVYYRPAWVRYRDRDLPVATLTWVVMP